MHLPDAVCLRLSFLLFSCSFLLLFFVGYCRNGDSCPYFHDKTLHSVPSQTNDHLNRKNRSSGGFFLSNEEEEEEDKKLKKEKKIEEREEDCNVDNEDDVPGSVDLQQSRTY